MNQKIHKVEVKLSIKEISKEIWNELTNEIFNLERLWEIKSIKNLMNNEIHIHYKKI